jgi:membrane-bound metal-dependent hydrolase YbcI (DUF457 family)
MSKGGHLITAAVIAYAMYERTASPVLAVATVAASSFPDVIEIVNFTGGRRLSLIPHRTITHWFPLYIAIWIATLALTSRIPLWGVNMIHGICLASTLHIFMDLFSPCGVPILTPFGRRVSFGLNLRYERPCLYRTGSLDQLPIIGATIVLTLCFLVPHPAPLSLSMFAHHVLQLFSGR